jgi:heme-degrading monooxygenase HmoA
MSLIRIVKMTFHEEYIETFLHIFEERKERIASFPGCNKLELLNEGNVFFTYSVWDDAASLEKYRNSELFRSTWALTKKLFAAKAEAWSVRKVE